MNGAIKYFLTLGIFNALISCSTYNKKLNKNQLSINILNEYLNYNPNFFESYDQIVQYEIINHSNETIVLYIDDSYFNVANYDQYLNGSEHIKVYRNLSLGLIFYTEKEENIEVIPIPEIRKRKDCWSLTDDKAKFLVLNPFSKIQLATRISLPIYHVDCMFVQREGEFENINNYIKLYDVNSTNVGIIFNNISFDNTSIQKELNEFKRKGFKIFRGEIKSNFIPIKLTPVLNKRDSIDPNKIQLFENQGLKSYIKGFLGGESFPGGTRSWGKERVWITPDSNTIIYGRSGFTIHGGDVYGSAGCIDLGPKSSVFFKALRSFKFQEIIPLTVKY